jgi:hypothetical protein
MNTASEAIHPLFKTLFKNRKKRRESRDFPCGSSEQKPDSSGEKATLFRVSFLLRQLFSEL